MNVSALDFSAIGEVWKPNEINRFVSNEKGYLMAYESDKPVQFCFKFARSADLSKWEKIPGVTFMGEHQQYSACPVIRYIKPYYYVI